MAKVRELLTNNEVQRLIFRAEHVEKSKICYTQDPRSQRYAPDRWLKAAVPAFHGLVPNAPWVQYLCQLIHLQHL